ncbi:MAG: spore germination protein [Lachnospiraceae bacterium]|nr:spore germination protein [Lachnospiraceae bacterium]
MEQLYNSNHEITAKLDKNLKKNEAVVKTLFSKCDDIVEKEFQFLRQNQTIRAYMVYIDGLTDSEMLQDNVIAPLQRKKWEQEENIFQAFFHSEIDVADLKEETSFDKVINYILKGDTALFIDGYAKVIIISSKKLPTRGVEESKAESVMRGPRDSFNESLRTCTALIRRRIKDPKCKIEQEKFGERSRTDYALIYMEDLVQEGLVEEIKAELDSYKTDAIYDSGMLEHFMNRKWYSPFPLIQSTERPDKVASSILEGRVAIVVDNSPEVLLLPATFNTFFQASDDYYNQWSVATFARILRYIASILAIGLPGFYIAITSFHLEMLPTELLLAIAQARSSITFPIVVEVLLMELEFELLREAGIRLPGPMGNTIGIVGGLIVGQAAVEAGLVSTIVVIVVALGALASFTIPNESFASAYRLLKFFLILVSAIWGLYGFVLGMLMIAIHLSGLTSYGVPYMVPAVSTASGRYESVRDFILRLPIYTMKKRPVFTKEGQRNRMRKKI